ncbi:MAG: hypothetical protein A3F72_02165 [Bacteroidetes bacterium RIFCSPLOWO2_12_FULL_35_15]|nr:MAG: hypothetical protein A3F72_02165 [Bacteroidetes bacterium RIFCSPLOWO2_12_FULL_35_15]
MGLNEDCIWFVNNQPIDTVAGLWVKPVIPTTYVLQQNICGTVTYDSVKVNISGVGVNELSNNEGLKIYPNPANTSINLEFKNSNINNYSIELTNVLGQLQLVNSEIRNSTITIYIENLLAGIYFVKAISKEDHSISVMKFVKE